MFSATRQWSGGFQPSRNYNCASEEKDPTSTRVGICNPLFKKNVPWVPGRHCFLPCSRWQVRPPRSAAPVHLIPSDHSCCEPMKAMMLNMDLAIWGSGFTFRWHMYIYIYIYIYIEIYIEIYGVWASRVPNFARPNMSCSPYSQAPRLQRPDSQSKYSKCFFHFYFLTKTNKIEGSV